MKIDWKLLRAQKAELLAQVMQGKQMSMGAADGLLHLLDAIQDEAVAEEEATELEVFGPLG